jgi:hypothetical protein
MQYLIQTDSQMINGSDSTSGKVEPVYVFRRTPILKEKDIVIDQFDGNEQVELTGEEEDRFYQKVMRTTLL